MKKYKLRVAASAEKTLKKLQRQDQQRISKAILRLASEPFPRGTRKLTGHNDVYRIRVGHFRIIYSVKEKTITIIILKIGHRKEVYR